MLCEIFLLIFGVICVFIVAIEWKKWRLNSTKLKNYKFLPAYPIVGVGGEMIGTNNEDVMRKINELLNKSKTSPAVAWFGPSLIIAIDVPEDLQIILNADQFLDKPFVYKYLRNETGLLASPKNIWKIHRRALNPTLSSKVVASFIPIFNEKFQTMADQMEQYVGKNIDVYRIVFKASGDSILNTALGMNWKFQTQRGDEIHDLLVNFMSHFMTRVVRFWLRSDFVYSLTKECKEEQTSLHKFYQFMRTVAEVKALELAEKMACGDDELEKAKEANSLNWIQKCFLMKREGKFDDLNLHEESDTVFVGATDTTSVAMTVILLMLAVHQEQQDRVVAELHEIFDKADSPISNEDLSKMTYTEMVIKESLRLFPVIPYIARECTEDFEFKDGIIPKGAVIFASIFKLHRDPRYWGKTANVFNPERFLPEHFSKMHPYTFLAFSGGPRNCIGMRYAWCTLKMAVAYLLRRYRFTTHLKFEDIRIKTYLMLKIANENSVCVEHRQW